MAGANVPKFGEWGKNNVPYTVCFDNLRKNRGSGKLINPNDPQENPEMFRPIDPSPPPLAPLPSRPRPRPKPRPRPEELVERKFVRPTPEPKPVREDFDLGQFGNSSSRNDNALNNGGREQKLGPRPGRVNMGPNKRFEPSPLHPRFEPKDMGKGSGSPVWNGRNNENNYIVPGKSRLNASTHRGDDKPGTGPTIPKFPVWNDNPNYDPNYTEAFNKWRDDRDFKTKNHLGTTDQQSDSPDIHLSNQPKQCCVIL